MQESHVFDPSVDTEQDNKRRNNKKQRQWHPSTCEKTGMARVDPVEAWGCGWCVVWLAFGVAEIFYSIRGV